MSFTKRTIGSPSDPRVVAAADVDGDGLIDVVVGCASKLYWYKQNSDGSFTETLIGSSEEVLAVTVADIDSDSDRDILVSTSGDNDEVALYVNDGSN